MSKIIYWLQLAQKNNIRELAASIEQTAASHEPRATSRSS